MTTPPAPDPIHCPLCGAEFTLAFAGGDIRHPFLQRLGRCQVNDCPACWHLLNHSPLTQWLGCRCGREDCPGGCE